MTIFRHEMRANRTSLCIWCGAVCAMTMLVMLMYPSFADQMDSISRIFAMMGPFTAAFGMDVLQLGTAVGFYGVESGAMLAICGSMFAAYTGISLLAKEEGGHTAEFLLTQPVSRGRVVLEKLLALAAQLVVFNAVVMATGALLFAVVGEPLPTGRFVLFHASQLLLHLQIGCVCLGLSAFFRRAQVGLALGVTMLLYFFNLMANMVEAARPLRYATPFAYADAAQVLGEGSVDGMLMGIGVAWIAVGVAAALWRYHTKDVVC